jgi:carbamoyl-phosphate synthase large subunit
MALTVLLSSAGRRNQLLGCFREDAQALGLEIRVLAADLRPHLSSACQQADASFAVPRCNAPDFIPAMAELCRKESVDLLVPTIDTELAVLSQYAVQFAAVETRVAVSSPDVVALAGNKQLTAERLQAAGVPTPRTLGLADYLRDPGQLRMPVIAKPTGGSSSVGIIRPARAEDLRDCSRADYLVQELWEGREYTVNVFFDQAGRLRCAIPHERIETRGGEVSKGVTRRVPALEDAAQKLAAVLPEARGPLCFQAIVIASGDYAVFEINARFGGGYPLAHRAGARFSQWLLEEAAGLPCSANNDWKEGVTMLRYDSAVFLND